MFTVSEILGKDKISKLKKQHDEYARKTGELEIEIINSVFKIYMDEGKRSELLEKARTFNFSQKKTDDIERAFTNYNEDNITYNIASDIIDAQNHIQEYDRESLFSQIANIVIPKDD